jgi:MYXO-CTERM domain-containing protein
MAKNNIRLDGYFANVSRRKNSVSDWRIYAAVTGSAMAMATNASAGVIYFNQAVTVGPVDNVGMGSTFHETKQIALKNAMGGNIGPGFRVGVFQDSASSGGSRSGYAFIAATGSISLLHTGKLKKLAFGANISTAPGRWAASGTLDLAIQTNAGPHGPGWAANATGLAGFRFSTTNSGFDYGWIRLSYTLGTNNLANSITATDWGYDPTGAPVTAGETASSTTPEPSTTALAILAAGAAGVAALRRRRHESCDGYK